MEYIIEYKSGLYKGGKARHVFDRAEAGAAPIKTNTNIRPETMGWVEAKLFRFMKANRVDEMKMGRVSYKLKN